MSPETRAAWVFACACLALASGWVIDRYLTDDEASTWDRWDMVQLAALVAAVVLAVGALGMVTPEP